MFVTGRPGVGKTTLIMRVIEELKKQGYTVGGMVTNEVLESGQRVGFELTDLYSNKKGELAHVNRPSGPKVGKYRVNLECLSSVGATSIKEAVAKTDIVVIDEVGPMELNSEEFKSAVKEALGSSKLVIGTFHFRLSDPLIKEIGKRRDASIFEVDVGNRGFLPRKILDAALLFLRMGRAK